VGSVSKRKDADGRPGLWITRWREPDGTQRKRSFTRKRDAEEHLRAIEASIDTRTYVTPEAGRETVGDYGRAWLDRRVDLTPKSRASVRSLWRSRVEPVWGAVRLDAVRHQDVARWVAAMADEGLSASRVRQAYHLLTALLDAAVRDSRLVRNPADGVRLPRLRTTTRAYLSHEQLHAMADAAGDYRPLVLLLGYCGLRWGEAAALRVGDIDLTRSRVIVQRAVVDVDGHMIEGAPKTHQRREVPMPRVVRDAVAEHIAGRAVADLAFPSPRGSFLRVQNARRQWWDTAARTAGVEGLTPHGLRHTCAALAVAAGADARTVQRMLGHASAAMTLDVYGGLFDRGLDDVAARLDAAAPQVRPGPGDAPQG
jgi:integrase